MCNYARDGATRELALHVKTQLRARDWAGAERCARLGVAADPSLHGLLARTLRMLQRDSEAIVSMRAALRLEPAAREGWMELARTHYAQHAAAGAPSHEQEEMASAAAALEEAARLAPGDIQVHGMLADAYYQLSRANFSYAQRAALACRRVLQLDVRDGSAWTNLAKAR